MRKVLASIVATVLGISLLTAFSGVAVADHYWATGQTDRRIALLIPEPIGCAAGPILYDANEGFYVQHGWSFGPWSELPPMEKRAIMHPSTNFELLIDGVLQHSQKKAAHDSENYVKFKLFVIENHKGLSGEHEFHGVWHFSAWYLGGDFRDSEVGLECTVTVIFS